MDHQASSGAGKAFLWLHSLVTELFGFNDDNCEAALGLGIDPHLRWGPCAGSQGRNAAVHSM